MCNDKRERVYLPVFNPPPTPFFLVDSRLLHVLLPVKQWAYSEGLLDPNSGKLSGYLITLMTVFYLQAGLIKPGIWLTRIVDFCCFF